MSRDNFLQILGEFFSEQTKIVNGEISDMDGTAERDLHDKTYNRMRDLFEGNTKSVSYNNNFKLSQDFQDVLR